MQNSKVVKKDNLVLKTLGNILFVLGILVMGALIFWFFHYSVIKDKKGIRGLEGVPILFFLLVNITNYSLLIISYNFIGKLCKLVNEIILFGR